MKTLFLTSYFAGVETLFNHFARQQQVAKQVLFIPTAGNVESYVEYIHEAQEMFRKLGFALEILDIANATEAVIRAKLAQTPYLYVSGGNTFYLLQELKKKHLLEPIKQRIAEGMVYIGESAGAIIAAKDIEYNQIMDDKAAAPELTDYAALHLVDFSVVPHYGEFPFEESAAQTVQTYQSTHSLLPLTNKQAVLVKGNHHSVETEPQD